MEVLGVLTALVAASVYVDSADPTSRQVACYHHDDHHQSVYDFTLPDVHGEKNISFSDYRGQYYGLNALQETYKNFQIIGLPCNQFGKQEPGKNGTEILNGIKYVRPGDGFEPKFPLTMKIDVNGADQHPLYSYLKNYCPPVDDLFYTEGAGIFYKPYHNSDVRWNFEKFLINKEGKAVIRYPTRMIPALLMKDIEDLLEDTTNTGSTVASTTVGG